MRGVLRAGWPAVLLVAFGVVVLTGCLGPDEPDPTGTAPFGHLDAVVAVPGGFRAVGWVVDPDTAAPIEVTVSSEQRTVKGVADGDRPDLVFATRGLGTRHGFDVRFGGLGPGPHQVCVWADNVGRGSRARALGCTYVTVPEPSPFGSLELVAPAGDRRVHLSGWAIDPDTSAPIGVGVLLDGKPVLNAVASQARPDVAGLGFGTAHGFSFDVPAEPGPHQLCVIAENVGPGAHSWLGCRVVAVPEPRPDRRPVGSVTAVEPQPGAGAVAVRGTASDPDTTAALQVRIAVDGVTTTVSTSGGSYSTVISGLSAGTHRVCVTAVDAPYRGAGAVITGDRSWPCGTVILGDVSVGSSGAPGGPTVPVGPSAASPIATVDRDAGISVQLNDGSVLWLFGDSSQLDWAGRLQYFVNNTAAWAPAGSPTVTRDAVQGGAPVQFVTPAGSSWTCPADHPNKAMWPASAVRTDGNDGAGGRDLVTAFFSNVCLGDEFLEIVAKGISVVQWTYDPANKPNGTPIQGTVVNHELWPTQEYGQAATTRTVSGTTYVYGYKCVTPPQGTPLWPNVLGPCHVGRVPVGSVTTASSWRYWNGSGWVTDPAQAAAVIPGPAPGVADTRAPVAGATVSFDATHGVYVMGYSPWPGFTDRVFVRVATAPEGPWSDVVEVALPGCDDRVGSSEFYCYAGTVQPALSEPGLLGVGYYDQLVAVGPNRGQYLTVKVPFHVVITG